MQDYKEYEGMWKYFPSKKLLKKINGIATLKLVMKLDDREIGKSCCGMLDSFRSKCPFHCKISNDPMNTNASNHQCLAPEHDTEWYSIADGRKWIPPIYRTEHKVLGCYIIGYCDRGLENFRRIKAWKHRGLRR
jgi:hypothetical protein